MLATNIVHFKLSVNNRCQENGEKLTLCVVAQSNMLNSSQSDSSAQQDSVHLSFGPSSFFFGGDQSDRIRRMSSANDYKTTKLLGSGRFGQVFLANKKGKCFAVKKFHTAKKTTNVALQEIRLLKQVEHRHLVKYYGHYMEEKIVCLVLEYADKGTMEKFVLTQDQEEWDVWRFTSHVASALDFLHSKLILHFNLKPCKILGVTEPSRNNKEPGHRIYWKLTDVGATKTLTRDVQEVYSVGNLPVYIGPEVLTDLESYTAASDIWSLACVTAFYMTLYSGCCSAKRGKEVCTFCSAFTPRY